MTYTKKFCYSVWNGLNPGFKVIGCEKLDYPQVDTCSKLKKALDICVKPQQTFACSKLTIERIVKGVEMWKVNNKDTRRTLVSSFWYFYS